MRLSLAQMTTWGATVFATAGLHPDHAQIVAENLAYAESRGVSGHGFVRTQIYLDRIRAGGIRIDPTMTVVHDHGAMRVLDAGGAAGQASALLAVETAIGLATAFGIGCVIVRGANHFGAAAHFSEMIADAGMLGIVACNTDKAMCAPFGGARVLGTNPISIAVPVDGASRPVLDMATSEVSLGKLVVAAQKGDRIPLGWAVDAAGTPTESANEGLEGALLPSGGPKGFGLAFMVDMLAAIGGAETSPRIAPLYGDPAQVQNLGQLFIAIRTDSDGGPDFTSRVNLLVDDVHASGPGPAGHEALFPGEPELRRRIAGEGWFDMSEPVAVTLAALGRDTGVAMPAAEAGT